jgi:phage gp36-like protein
MILTPIPTPSLTSHYAQQSDLINKFGTTDITQWSDVDGTGIINTTRIGIALVWADNVINQNFGPSPHGVYNLPVGGYLTLGPMGTVLCTDWACWIAVAWLYQPRGMNDEYKTKIEPGLTRAIRECQQAAAGNLIYFDAARGYPVSDGPVSVHTAY